MDILVVKPEEINDYIKAETIGISAPRDFVSKVQEYLQSIGRRVLLVTGLRSEITASNIVIDEYSWITDKDGELANYIAGLNKLGEENYLNRNRECCCTWTAIIRAYT